MSQCAQVLDHIQRYGYITPYEAFVRYGILAMHSRAAELRERGFDVVCTIKSNGKRRWGCYSLRGQAELAL